MVEITEQRKMDIEQYVAQNIWLLNPTGMLEKIITLFCEVEKTYAPKYTANIVGQRYIDYFNKWSYEHADQEEKYIRNDDKLMDVYTFITKRSYMGEFAIIRKGRDFYLFGDMLKEELQMKLAEFKKSIAHGRK